MSQYDLNSNVLMIGHSLVGPTMPWLAGAAAGTQGGSANVDAQIINGASLAWQWDNGAFAQGVNARAVLPSGSYDVVVMTEAVPLLNHLTWSGTTTYVENYYDLAVASNPDARVYVYETWHSLNSGTGVPVQWDDEDHIPWRQRLDNDIDRWQGIADDVNAGVATGQPEVMLIPAGQAMALLYDRIEAGQVPGVSSINQFFMDDIHLNDLGLYFVTMVQYATIFGDDPSNIPAQLSREGGGTLGPSSEALADVLQDIAWTAVTSYDGSGVDADEGGITSPPPPPDFGPDALDDAATTDEGSSVAIDVLANDSDPDGAGLTILSVADPTSGSAAIVSGQVVYTSDSGFSGSDIFSYTVVDANGDTDTANVAVTVNSAPVSPPPPSGDGAALTNPSMAVGLAGVVDWSVQQPFLDVMKTARAWQGNLEGQWGGWTYDELVAGEFVDENGWPTDIPPGVGDIVSVILTDLPTETADYTGGRYRVTYEGEGQLIVGGGGASNVQYGDGEIWFNYEPGPGPVMLAIRETDPNGTGNNIRNISVVHEENIEALEKGELFNPLWLDRIDDFRSVRFMDWMVTNNSEQSEWANRPQVDDFSWATDGVPLEIMIELANQIGADPWFNMPHLATDDYMREFAVHVRDYLDPDLRAYVEYSNEVWNWQFEQARWAEEQGQARWGQDNTWSQFGATRATEMAQIWRDVYGQESDARLDLVLAVHPGWLGLEQDMLNGPLWVAEDPQNNLPTYTYFDSYATTGYFSGDLGYGDKASIVLGWIGESESRAIAEADGLGLSGAPREAYITNNRYNHAVELAIQELRDGSVTGAPANTLEQLINTNFVYHGGVAEQFGLDLIMYEGGTHVVGVEQWVGNQTLTDFFTYLNYTDEMGELYEELLAGWRDSGGQMFNAFVDVYTPNQWGSWGHLRTLTDESMRWDAIVDFNTNNPAWWDDDRSTGAFIGTRETSDPSDPVVPPDPGDPSNPVVPPDPVDPVPPPNPVDLPVNTAAGGGGITLHGAGGNDVLYAAAGANTINGGGGNDVLAGGLDNDNLSGGAGNDILIGDTTAFITGTDTLNGGIGDDLLEGGGGADTFIFNAGDGADTIGDIAMDFGNLTNSTVSGPDFVSGVDTIVLTGFGLSDGAAALALVTDVGGVATFSDQGTTITFAGLTAADLAANDFQIL